MILLIINMHNNSGSNQNGDRKDKFLLVKGPMRGQYKHSITKKVCMFYFTIIYSEDLASVLLEMFMLISKVLWLSQELGYEG